MIGKGIRKSISMGIGKMVDLQMEKNNTLRLNTKEEFFCFKAKYIFADIYLEICIILLRLNSDTLGLK